MKKLVPAVLALILFAAITVFMVATAGAQEGATPVPEAPDASGLAALVVAILVALILAILAGQ